jgi:predicted Zn-dependent protease
MYTVPKYLLGVKQHTSHRQSLVIMATSTQTSTPLPLIEIGWVVAGRLDDADQAAVDQAREDLLAYLQKTFAAFTWHMPVVEHAELVRHTREEPVVLLDYGITERATKHWDFALVVTGADLHSYYKPYALGAPSRSVNVAVMSTVRLDPQATHSAATLDERTVVMARRLGALALHLFGHLNGLSHHDDPHEYMYDVQTVDDLEQMTHFSAPHMAQLTTSLWEVADVRLEEAEPAASAQPLWFYVRSLWIGRDDIRSAMLRAKPWQFPFRLGRLTTAATSALLILLVTAEVWDVGMQQPPGLIMGLWLFTLGLTSLYILKRQRLLTHRQTGVLSEQTVFTNISITLVVLLGMLTTYGLLFTGALTLGLVFFQRRVITGWAVSLHGAIHTGHYVLLAAFVASLGLLIGALGASFEQQHYFRHITYIDEET